MAVANTKSTIITALDASPKQSVNSYLQGGILRTAVATVEVAAADDDGSVYRFFRLPSNARVVSARIYNDAITGGTAYELGLYQTAANGGAVVDADVYGSAISMASARVSPLDALFEALNIDQGEKRVWENAALTTDPQIEYDVCLTGTTVGTAAGTITLQIDYVL